MATAVALKNRGGRIAGKPAPTLHKPLTTLW